MIIPDFEAVIRDLEKNLEGDAYTIDILVDGQWLNDFAWQYLGPNRLSIILSKDDHRPIYVAIARISMVRLGGA